MKVRYEEIKNPTSHEQYLRAAYKIAIVDSLLKTHFKLLARMCRLFGYDKSEGKYTGYVTEDSKADFLALLEKIEKSSSKRAATSHKKAKAKKAKDSDCQHEDLGSLGYVHGQIVSCPHCGKKAEVW